MPHITHKTPSAYWNRHGDWYRGAFKDVVHGFALAEEYKFYTEYERRAAEINAYFVADFLGILSWLKNFLIGIEKAAYEKGYVDAYDNAALSGCKIMEKFDGEITATLGKINDAYNKAVGDAKALVTKVSDYINTNIAPPLDKAKADIVNTQNYINNTLNKLVSDAQQKANDATANVNSTITKLNSVISDVNSKAKQISDLQTQAQNAVGNINNLTAKINSIVADINAKAQEITNVKTIAANHTTQIADLYKKLGSTSPSTPNQTSNPLEKVLEKLQGH
jgi:methyl-accepting chemotaxis protein